jgi:hypothetical protein
MRVDIYQSQKQPSYGLVVPANVDPSAFSGEVGEAVAKLSPLAKKSSRELSSAYHGPLLSHLKTQIANLGAGLLKVQVHFSEIPR